MRRSSLAIGVVGVALVVAAALALGYSRSHHHSALEVPIAGGDGGALPIAQPSDEHLDSVALERGRADPAAAGLVAWLVIRHGHLVSEHYAHGMDRDSPVDLGPATRALVALLAGVAVNERAVTSDQLGAFDANAWKDSIERSMQRPYPELLSRRIWSRLNAARAWIELPAAAAPVPADCCVHARVQDWLRVGALLTDEGRFEDTQIVPAGWASRMLTQGLGVEPGSSAHGNAPFAIDDMVFLRGPGRWRLGLSPSLHLAVLFGSVAGAAPAGATPGGAQPHDFWDETRLPNLIIEAVTDRSSAQKGDSLLHQLVPNH
jgi:hypothetical protein